MSITILQRVCELNHRQISSVADTHAVWLAHYLFMVNNNSELVGEIGLCIFSFFNLKIYGLFCLCIFKYLLVFRKHIYLLINN